MLSLRRMLECTKADRAPLSQGYTSANGWQATFRVKSHHLFCPSWMSGPVGNRSTARFSTAPARPGVITIRNVCCCDHNSKQSACCRPQFVCRHAPRCVCCSGNRMLHRLISRCLTPVYTSGSDCRHPHAAASTAPFAQCFCHELHNKGVCTPDFECSARQDGRYGSGCICGYCVSKHGCSPACCGRG